MNQESNKSKEEILEDIRRLIPILGKDKASRLEIAYLLGDEYYRKKIQAIVDSIRASVFSDEELKDSVLIEPPAKDISTQGDFEIGTILYGKKEIYPLMLNRKDLLTHIGIFGSSGSGKTNVIHSLCMQFSRLNIPILIFDFSKRNYRDLLNIPELKDRMKIFTVGRNVSAFRFNPLKPPPGVQISQWAKEFAEVFDHAYWLLGGGRHVVLKALGELYNKFEPTFPKISDLSIWLERSYSEAISSREKNWIATAERPLESLCFRETGEVFDCDEGLLPSTFFEKSDITVLELDSLSTDDKTFFIEIMLQWIRDWILSSNNREKLVGVIVIEEAHHVLNREKTKKFGMETVTDLIFREIRELGIGMIYVDQHPSLVSYPALGNTSTHIYMNLGLDTKHSSDVQDAASMLGLRNEKDVDYLRRLPVGHAYILVRKSAFPNSFLLKFPLVNIVKGSVTDEMVSGIVGKKIIDEIRARMPIEVARDEKKLMKLVEMKGDLEKRMNRVEFNGWRMMELLMNGEAAATSEIYKKLKMSCKVFNEQVQRLVNIGFVESRKAKVYRQNSIFYFLTHDGDMALLLRLGKFPEEKNTAELNELKEVAKQNFTLNEFAIVAEADDHIIVEKKGRRFRVNLANEGRRGKIYDDVQSCVKDGEIYFVCSSDNVKNRVVQQTAKYSFEHRGLNIVLYAKTIGEFKESKDLKKIEFSPGS
jgi:DNA helicase HerA-like ATPase